MATYEELMQSAEQIRTNELPESNTHQLVGQHLKNQVEYSKNENNGLKTLIDNNKKEVDGKLAELGEKIPNTNFITCSTLNSVANKTVNILDFKLSNRVRLLVKMVNANAADNANLSISSPQLDTKPLYYNGERASSKNSWEAGAILDIYYDGANFQATDFQGGADITVDSELSETSANPVQNKVITAKLDEIAKNGPEDVFRTILGKYDITLNKDSLIDATFINTDGNVETNPVLSGQRYAYILDVSQWIDATIAYENQSWGNANQKAIAFYNGKETNAGTYISGVNSGKNKYETIAIPEGAVTCVIGYGGKVEKTSISLHSNSDSEIKKVIDENNVEIEKSQAELSVGIEGIKTYNINDYRQGVWIESDGAVKNNSVYTTRYASEKRAINAKFRGGILKFYRSSVGNTNVFALAFYDEDDTYISGIATSTAVGLMDVRIPENAVSYIHGIGTSDIEGFDKSITMTAALSASTLYSYDQRIARNSVNDYMLPLGVLDNLLQDVYTIDYKGTVGRANVYLKNKDGLTYGIRKDTSVREGKDYPIDTVACLKIKKSGNPNRIFVVRKTNGQEATFTEATLPADLTNKDFTPGKIIRNDSDYIWLYLSKVAGSCTVTSYKDNTKTEYEEMVLDTDKSFVVKGDLSAEEIDFDRKYYTRAEKLGSTIIGKTAVVFADSLSYYVDALYYDWGLNVITISRGGARMGYEGGSGAGGESGTANDLWLCNDDTVQAFKTLNVSNVDFIICSAGTNGTLPETNAEEVQYVLENKRWFHDTLDTNPWDALGDDDKNKFNSTACTYAAFYSMCAKYKGACAVVVEPYRTPGSGNTANPLTPEKYGSYLFNGNMINKQEALRKIATNLGAIYVESRTRDSIAAAEAYHLNDGVHPSFVVAQDMAANIGRDLSMIFAMLVE